MSPSRPRLLQRRWHLPRPARPLRRPRSQFTPRPARPLRPPRPQCPPQSTSFLPVGFCAPPLRPLPLPAPQAGGGTCPLPPGTPTASDSYNGRWSHAGETLSPQATSRSTLSAPARAGDVGVHIASNITFTVNTEQSICVLMEYREHKGQEQNIKKARQGPPSPCRRALGAHVLGRKYLKLAMSVHTSCTRDHTLPAL